MLVLRDLKVLLEKLVLTLRLQVPRVLKVLKVFKVNLFKVFKDQLVQLRVLKVLRDHKVQMVHKELRVLKVP